VAVNNLFSLASFVMAGVTTYQSAYPFDAFAGGADGAHRAVAAIVIVWL
jgi:hypothetical protein